MSSQEPKKISVSQVAKYKADGWKVVEYTDCGRYAFGIYSANSGSNTIHSLS